MLRGWAQWFIAVIPATWEVENGRIVVWGQLKQKVIETPISTKKLDVMASNSHPSYMGGVSRRIVVQANLGKKYENLPEK
jgi:hypothetical protein